MRMRKFAKQVARRAIRRLVRMVGVERCMNCVTECAVQDGVDWFDIDGWLLEPFATRALLSYAIGAYFKDDVGRNYGVDEKAKRDLMIRFRRIHAEVPSGTPWWYYVVLGRELLLLPADRDGIVVECGSWKGAGTACLSLLCDAIGRKLLVCDSFEGLPDEESNVMHEYPHLQVYGYYTKGMYAARLDEVRENVSRLGSISACEFLPGFYEHTLSRLKERVAFAFIDVDLESSLRECVRSIWPLLWDGGVVYTDDSCDVKVVRVWFDEPWWRSHLKIGAPGYVGSGCGLPLSPRYTAIGYARKVARAEDSYHRVRWLSYPES